jgi:Beta/Gamma crystallin
VFAALRRLQGLGAATLFSTSEQIMRRTFLSTLIIASLTFATSASAEIVVYDGDHFHGHPVTIGDEVGYYARVDLHDRASSVVVRSDHWLVCEDREFGGKCVVLSRGLYPSPAAMGLEHRIATVRVATDEHRDRDRR